MADDGCKDSLTELYSYLDGELTDQVRDRVKAHLDDCPPCYDAFDFEAELRQVIANRCREEVPAELKARIASALEAERT